MHILAGLRWARRPSATPPLAGKRFTSDPDIALALAGVQYTVEATGMAADAARTIYLVSDGTCRTCEQVVRAVLVQFVDENVRLVRKQNVRRSDTVHALVEQAAAERALIFYTLVDEETRAAMKEAAERLMAPAVDLLGPVLGSLYDLFKSAPSATPGALYQANKDHFDRIDAVDYTLHHDDGRGEPDLDQADVVLVGVSRASKSTTCFYLAYSGIRAANVPLFADRDPPKELLALDPRRVIGLTINPYRLRTVREARLHQWRMDLTDDYGDKRQIAREIRAAHEQMIEHGWRTLDVSYKAIEEIAREVRQMLDEAGVTIRDRSTDA